MSALAVGPVSTFLLGLLTPLTAVCVLPLYPGFLTFLSGAAGKAAPGTVEAAAAPGARTRRSPLLLGLLVVSGVISFMLTLGLLFSMLLEISLTRVLAIVTPAAFGLLALISLALILDLDMGRFIPRVSAPGTRGKLGPPARAYLFGFFFGAIVAPCNPGLIAAFFAKTLAATAAGFLGNFIHFLFFGIGIGFPLLLFSALSAGRSRRIIAFLTAHKTAVNRSAGIVMLAVSLYYLIFVFRLFG